MNQILCQGTDCKEKGCSACGGYGVILAKGQCKCGQDFWHRPGAYTTWEGKKYLTFDGLKRIAHLSEPDGCEKCEGI